MFDKNSFFINFCFQKHKKKLKKIKSRSLIKTFKNKKVKLPEKRSFYFFLIKQKLILKKRWRFRPGDSYKIKKYWKPILSSIQDTEIFYFFDNILNANVKKFKLGKIRSYCIFMTKVLYFIPKHQFQHLNSAFESWYNRCHEPCLASGQILFSTVPNYWKLKKTKKFKFLKYFRFFFKKKHSISQISLSYISYLTNLLRRNSWLRGYWYKKRIFIKFFQRMYCLKKQHLLSLKLKIKKVPSLYEKLEFRLDVVLVRLGFVSHLNQSRISISQGFVFVNFKKVYNYSKLIKKEDIIFLVNYPKNIERFLSTPFFRYCSTKSNYVFYKKRIKFFKNSFLQSNFKFFKNSFLQSSSSLIKTINLKKKYFFQIYSFDTLRLSWLRKNLNLNFLSFKNLNFFANNHF